MSAETSFSYNVSFDSTAVDQANTSEYNIGNTTYIVELHFNFDCKETLDDIIERLVTNNLENTA